MMKRSVAVVLCLILTLALSITPGRAAATEEALIHTASVYENGCAGTLVNPLGSSDVLYIPEYTHTLTQKQFESEVIPYNGPYVTVNDVRLPLEEYMPGSFFSKNGKACTCHQSPDGYCIASVGYCNCMRYYPTGTAETCEVDLLGTQCFGFARLVFYKVYGFIDHPIFADRFHSLGSLASGQVTAASVKKLLLGAPTAAHIRLSVGHSVSLLTTDEDYIIIYHGNAGGDGVTSAGCVVSTRRYTWEQFAAAAAYGISFVNVPNTAGSVTVEYGAKEIGYYKLYSAMNLRAEASADTAVLAVVPNETILYVSEINGQWGKVTYNNKTGWLYLQYSMIYSYAAVTPSKASGMRKENGVLLGIAEKQTLLSFTSAFSHQNLTVTDKDGKAMAEDDYITTGCRVGIIINDEYSDSVMAVVCGDVNGNGKVDVGDYMMVRRHILTGYELDDLAKSAADVNGSSSTEAADYYMIKRYLCGTLKSFW